MEFPAAPDELGVLARRIGFVERLREEPLHKADLVEEFDTSRSTVNRAIGELEDAGFVERIARGYVTTQAGRLAAERYRAFLDGERAVLEARPVLATLPHDADLPTGMLREATVGSPGDAYAFFELVAEQLGTATEYRAVLPRVVDSRHLRACHAQVVRGKLTATLACPADEFERLGEEFPHLTGELLDSPSFTAKASSVPEFGLMCFREEADANPPDANRSDANPPDSVVLLGYEGPDIAGFVHSEAPDATRWAARMLDSAIDEARDATAVIDRPDAAAAFTSLGGDRVPASLRSEGFVRIDERYFRRREPMAPLAGWRAGLGLPEVAAGYAVPRTPEGDENDSGPFAETLLARLRSGEDLALVGPPGAGKSTVCKRVACAWHERGHGPVFYRESGRGQSFDSVSTLERTVERALERGDGEVLVVVEDAVRAEANAIFELVDAFRGSDEVSFLLDSRESEWHDPDEFPVDARLRAVRRDALEVVGIPPLTEADCRNILDRIGTETGERPDLAVEELLAEVRRGRAGGGPVDGDDADAAPGEITLLLHRLVRYADSLSPSVEDDPPTGLDEDVDRVREDLATLGESALDAGVLVNMLNAAGLGVSPAAVYALAGEDTERHGTIQAALERLEGHLLFPAATQATADTTETTRTTTTNLPYRTAHETWSVRFLERLLDAEGEPAAGQRFGRCVTALLALADEPARREVVAREVGGDSQLLESVVAAPETWADETVEAVFGVGRTYPKLAPLFGTAEESAIRLPDACSETVAARCPEWRGWMYERAGAFDRAEREFERLAEVAQEDGVEECDRLLMESLLGRSDVARKQGNLEEAGVYAQECLDLATKAEDSNRRADASRRLGEIAWRRGEYEQAREYHERSLELERDLGDRRGEAETLKDLGTVAHQQGDYERAREYFQRSLAIKRDLGDRLGEANTLNNLGVIAETQGEYEDAREYHERSLELARDLGDRRGETYSLQNLGKVAAHQGACRRAREYHEQALEIARDLDDSHGEAHSVIQLGTIALRKGDHERAREQLETGLELVCELGIQNEKRRALWALAALAREKGAYEQAETHLEAARNPDDDGGDPLMDARVRLERARLALARDDLDTARRRGQDAREAFDEIGALHWVGRTRRLLGRVAAAPGSAEPGAAVDEGTAALDDREAALDHWEAALEAFETVGAPQDALVTLNYLVTHCRERGQDDEAREYHERARELLAEAPEPVAVEHEEWVDEVGETQF